MFEFLQKNTITIAELQAKTDKFVTATERFGRPFLITKNGKPTALLLDVKQFLNDLAVENLARQIARGEADIAAGRVQDLDVALKEIRRARKVSRSPRPRRKG